ncbi:MAG: type II secretion system protein [Pseudomonadales bacterium]|nr:type II secretion system protein [Pseudomonadales bacterium]
MGGREQQGFTLVELITVIMVLGILSIGTVRFITDSTSGLASTISRSELAGDTLFAVERISRSLRDALPNSVRVAGSCIEFVPVVAASSYRTLPVAAAASSFLAVPFDPLPVPAGLRSVVYPGASLYSMSSPGVISGPVSVSAADANNEVTVTMAAPHQFSLESPSERVFLVDAPISYCVDGGRLWRYQNYGFLPAQPVAVDLPAGRPDRALIAESVANPAPFTIAVASLTRNAVVKIEMEFVRGTDSVRIDDLVQVRNVP